MKRMKRTLLKVCIILFVVAVFAEIFVRCTNQKQKNISNPKRTEQSEQQIESVDQSNYTYAVSHYNGEAYEGRTLTATCGEDCYYVNGDDIYLYGSDEPILEDVNVVKMFATESLLFVLNGNALTIVNPKTLKTYIIDNVIDVSYDEKHVFLYHVREEYQYYELLYCSAEDIVVGDKLLPLEKFEVIYVSAGKNVDVDDTQICIAQNHISLTWNNHKDDMLTEYPFYYYNNHKLYASAVLDNMTGIYTVDPSTYREKCLNYDLQNKYKLSNNNVIVAEEKLYVLANEFNPEKHYVEEMLKEPNYVREQNDIIRDVILCIDFKEQTVQEVYATTDNAKKIVGYDLNKNQIFLYDVKKSELKIYNLETAEEKQIAHIEKQNTDLTFEMTEELLFVYGKDNSLIQVISLYE